MRLTTFSAICAFIALALVVACGGGGGSGGGGNGGGSGGTQAPPAGQYLEFIGVNRSGNLDPMNLQVGDIANVQFVNYDPAGKRTVLNATNYTISTGPGQATITSTGRLTILAKPPGVFRIGARATVAGQVVTLSQDALVADTGNTTFSGTVRADGSTAGMVYVQVQFYNANGEVVAGARTGDNGVFRAKIPTTVRKVSIKGASIPTNFFKSIRYINEVYTMDDPGCAVPVRTVKAGQNNSLAAPLFVPPQAGGPPPPPSGCLAD
ncbi:MAG: hypothetical protein KIT11_10775 [Fimbriimonadaceae bacterium]|nr:hypothetical protein [Fimbriimonadaceae bacterium]QYK55804.1 MAG: hypothetical protein KF733_12445 [Fimbriimonadaceae bacterium]